LVHGFHQLVDCQPFCIGTRNPFPVLLLFNDADEEFAVRRTVLLERRAENYLDIECFAMADMLLFEYLKTAENKPV
jgi:hypothetical protein